MTKKVLSFARLLTGSKLIPESQKVDAIQLACATVYRVDFLLTWNYAHLANPEVQRHLEALGRLNGWTVPTLVSPETIPKVSLGQQVRRKQ